MPASSYYVLVFAIAIAAFFLILGIFQDKRGENQWVIAGLSASVILGGGVLVREVLMRRVRDRRMMSALLEGNLRRAFPRIGDRSEDGKITLEQNAAALARIKEKSDAAKVFPRVAEGHREVFELCEDYRRAITTELAKVHPSSPRVAAFLRGREKAAEYHRYHMMRWVEIESTRFVEESRSAGTVAERMSLVDRSAKAVDLALGSYPDDKKLIDSALVIRDRKNTIAAVQLSADGERAANEGDLVAAEKFYRDALSLLAEPSGDPDHGPLKTELEAALQAVVVHQHKLEASRKRVKK